MAARSDTVHQNLAPGIQVVFMAPGIQVQIYQPDEAHQSPLFTAVMSGDSKQVGECIKTLLESNRLKEALKLCDNEGLDAVNWALKYNQFDIAEMLLRAGANLEERNRDQDTRLMFAVKSLSDKAVQFLLRKGANINALNKKNEPLLIELIIAENYDLALYLIEQGANFEIKDTAGKSLREFLGGLPKTLVTDQILYLINNPNRRPERPINYKQRAIDALMNGNLAIFNYVTTMLGEPNFLSDPIHDDEKTPLHIAAERGYLDMANFLLEKTEEYYDTGTDWSDSEGNTPFLLAARAGRIEILKLLTAKMPRVNFLDEKNTNGETALILAERNNHAAVVQYISAALAERKRIQELSTLTIPEDGFRRDSFVKPNMPDCQHIAREVLQIKGVALILQYYNDHDYADRFFSPKPKCAAYVAEDEQSLKKALSLLMQIRHDVEYGIIFRMGVHFMAIKCEKIERKNHIILMDSLGSLYDHPNILGARNHAELLERIVREVFADQASTTFFYQNRECRQSSGELCSIFALKDIRKMMSTPRFSYVIETTHQAKLEKQEENANAVAQAAAVQAGITVISYRTPPEYARLTQSPDALQQYIQNNKQEAQKSQFLSKQGKLQTLEEYALRPRYKRTHLKPHELLRLSLDAPLVMPLVTPQYVPNKHYPNVPGAPEKVAKNNTVVYFLEKYIEIIDDMFDRTQRGLANIIEKRNARHLKIAYDGTVMTVKEEMDTIKRRQGRIELAEIKERAEIDAVLPKARYKEIDLRKYGVLEQDDILTSREVWDYIDSAENLDNRLLFSPSFLMSLPSFLEEYNVETGSYVNTLGPSFDRISHFKMVAKELREQKLSAQKLRESVGTAVSFQFNAMSGAHSAAAAAARRNAAAAAAMPAPGPALQFSAAQSSSALSATDSAMASAEELTAAESMAVDDNIAVGEARLSRDNADYLAAQRSQKRQKLRN